MEKKTKNEQLDEYLDIGRTYRESGQIQQAIEKFQQVLKLAEELKDEKKKAEANCDLGWAYLKNSQNQKSMRFFEKCLEVAKKQGYKENESHAYLGLGAFCICNNQIQKGKEYYKNALEITKEQEDKENESRAYIGLGDSYMWNNQIQEGKECYEKAMEIAKERGYQAESRAYLGLGLVCACNNQIQKALEYYKKALKVTKEQGCKEYETQVYLAIGDTYRSNNQIQKAIEYFEKALKTAKKQGYQDLARHAMEELSRSKDADDEGHNTTTIKIPGTSNNAPLSNSVNQTTVKAKSTTNHTVASAEQLLILGRSYQTEGRSEEAIKCYEEAVQIANETNHNGIKARGYQHLGNVFAQKSVYKKAIEYYQKAREISPHLDGDELEITAYQWLGYKFQQAGQYEESIKYYNEVIKLASKLGNNEREINGYLGLGSAFSNKGDFESARKYFSVALTVAEAKNNKSLQKKAYKNLAVVHYKTCKYNAAVDLYLKVLEMTRDLGEKKEEWHACLMLGHTFRHLKQHKKAIKYYRKALRINKELEDKEMLENNFEKDQERIINEWCGYCCFLVGQDQEAITCHERAKEIAKQVGDKYQEYRTNQAIGNTLCNIGNCARANENYQEALRIAVDLGDKRCRGTACLNLASACSKNCDYKNAKEWYKKALDIFGTEFDDHILKETAVAGLAIARFNLKKTQKAIKSVPKVQKILNDETDKERSESWRWDMRSKVHKEKFEKLFQYGKEHPEEIKKINGVRVCCSKEFLIGMGSHGTRVYVGLGADGYEKAVKRLPRDACTDEAEQEKRVLNELNATKSQYVVNYWFLDEQSDKDYLFLILDLCEETLETFVASKSSRDLVTIAPVIIQQILNGLADLHRHPKPVLHRDLKPSNILRDVDGNWLLADFGISRILTAGATTHPSEQRGTDDWRAVESSHHSNCMLDNIKVRFKKESDIQVAGMLAFYVVTKGQHPFGEVRFRLDNLLNGKPVGLDKLKDPALKDLLSWMLSHDPKDRPSAEEALKHPYLQPARQQFEMLCKMGNQPEIKTGDGKSDVVRKLNSNPKDWRSLVRADILQYLSTDPLKRKTFNYTPSWTDCLRLIRNVDQHWDDRPRPRPEVFYVVDDPQKYFLNLFPHLPVNVHRIVRSCDWKERRELKEYFV